MKIKKEEELSPYGIVLHREKGTIQLGYIADCIGVNESTLRRWCDKTGNDARFEKIFETAEVIGCDGYKFLIDICKERYKRNSERADSVRFRQDMLIYAIRTLGCDYSEVADVCTLLKEKEEQH